MKNLKIAEIVPVGLLDYTRTNAYHMCLAHLVLASKEYAEFYKARSAEGKFVLMDNGAAEGEKMNFEDLLEAYKIVNPTEIILPDVLFDASETFMRSVNFYEKYHDQISGYRTMIVPQGISYSQWIRCLDQIADNIPFDTIGVPKWLGNNNSNLRLDAVTYLNEHYNKEIHLLGCSENPTIIAKCREANERVRGCDSAFAYLCSKERLGVINERTLRPNQSIDFLNDTCASNLDFLMSGFEKCAGVENNKPDITWR